MIIYKPVIIMGENFIYIDKTWVEYSNRLIIIKLVVRYSRFNFNRYKIFIFILLNILFIFIFYFYIYLNSLSFKA